MPSGGTLFIEEIQDQVELQLMRREEHSVAKRYILYREERAKKRGPVEKPTISIETETDLKVTKKDGTTVPLDIKRTCKDNY